MRNRQPVSRAPIRAVMKHEGLGLVSEKAIKLMQDKITEKLNDAIEKAAKCATADNRKIIAAADIECATRGK